MLVAKPECWPRNRPIAQAGQPEAARRALRPVRPPDTTRPRCPARTAPEDATAASQRPGQQVHPKRRSIRRKRHAGHHDPGPVAAGEFIRGTVRGNDSPRVPGSRAHPRRAASPQGPGRVRPVLQRPPAASGFAAETSTAPGQPRCRYHRPDREQPCRGRVDHRVPQSGLASAKSQVSGYESDLARHTPTAPTRSYAARASAPTLSLKSGASCANSAVAPGKPGSRPRPPTSFRTARPEDDKGRV
jgi:hypothetical protein